MHHVGCTDVAAAASLTAGNPCLAVPYITHKQDNKKWLRRHPCLTTHGWGDAAASQCCAYHHPPPHERAGCRRLPPQPLMGRRGNLCSMRPQHALAQHACPHCHNSLPHIHRCNEHTTHLTRVAAQVTQDTINPATSCILYCCQTITLHYIFMFHCCIT